MRIDLLLWYVRVVRSRALARALAERGVVRANGVRVTKAHHMVRPGDVLTVPAQGKIIVAQIVQLPRQRLPAREVADYLVAPQREPPTLRHG